MVSKVTGFVSHELYFWHDTGSAAAIIPSGLKVQPDAHAENAETKRRLLSLLQVSDIYDELHLISPEPVALDDLYRFHSKEYVSLIKELSDSNGGDAGEFAPVGRGSYEIARLSVGGCITALDSIFNEEVKNAYALVRPPGHHAESGRGRGFCIFGNGVITTMYARSEYNLDRVAIVDWDVHHGNSQELAFIEDPGVLTISLHQDNYYPPESGYLENVGKGRGVGANLNIPLPPGSGHGAYTYAFDTVVIPALKKFKPEMIIVSSGFDGSALDPLGRMMLHSETYRYMTKELMKMAGDYCDERLLLLHEGGYSTAYVPYCGLAVIEELSGAKTKIDDPFLPIVLGMGGQETQPHQKVLIDKASLHLSNVNMN